MTSPVTGIFTCRTCESWEVRRIHARDVRASASWRRRVATGSTLVALGLMGGACAGADDASDKLVRLDSAGVTLVLNRQTDRMLDWRFERILELGGADDGPTAFFRVFPTSIGVDSLANLYVLDAGNYTISVFDGDGRHLRSFGRQGEGPGELGFPSDLAVTPAGEVAVYDFRRRALVLFDANGSFTGTFPLPGPLQRKVALLRDGRIAAAVSQATHTPDSTDFSLLALGDDTVEVARVRRLDRHEPQRFSCMELALPPYFEPRVVWAAAGNRIAFNDDDHYSVRVVDGNRIASIWRRDLPVIESTLELAAWEAGRGDSLRFRMLNLDCVVPAEEAARKFGYADVAPTVRDLAIAPDGAVWLRRRTEVPGRLPIDVLDATGAYVGTLPGESPFPALFRGTDEIVTVETDGYGLPHVIVYRIHRGA
jgi:hypothetical protein